MESHMEYRSGNDDNKPLFTWEAEGKNAPLQEQMFCFHALRRTLLVTLVVNLTYLCCVFLSCSALMKTTGLTLIKMKSWMSRVGTSWWTPWWCLSAQEAGSVHSEGWQREQTARSYSDFNVTSDSKNCESQGEWEATRKVLNGHQNILTLVCYRRLSRGSSEATLLW